MTSWVLRTTGNDDFHDRSEAWPGLIALWRIGRHRLCDMLTRQVASRVAAGSIARTRAASIASSAFIGSCSRACRIADGNRHGPELIVRTASSRSCAGMPLRSVAVEAARSSEALAQRRFGARVPAWSANHRPTASIRDEHGQRRHDDELRAQRARPPLTRPETHAISGSTANIYPPPHTVLI